MPGILPGWHRVLWHLCFNVCPWLISLVIGVMSSLHSQYIRSHVSYCPPWKTGFISVSWSKMSEEQSSYFCCSPNFRTQLNAWNSVVFIGWMHGWMDGRQVTDKRLKQKPRMWALKIIFEGLVTPNACWLTGHKAPFSLGLLRATPSLSTTSFIHRSQFVHSAI